LVFEHVGGRTWFEAFLAILANRRRQMGKDTVFAGVTSVLSEQTHPLWHLGPRKVLDLERIAGAHRLIYGLDFPWNTVETNRRDIRLLRELPLTEEDKAMILGGTLTALLSPK
jgi:predicted TIM-barrel fold metal-dependent hydrolase